MGEQFYPGECRVFTHDRVMLAMTRGFLRAALELPAGQALAVEVLWEQGYTVTAPEVYAGEHE